jgi:HPr kinase/phosphorylase
MPTPPLIRWARALWWACRLTDPADRLILHATCIAVDGRGLLIMGPSGSGKSALALQLIAYGAQLVADDRTEITRQGEALIATCPAAIRGRIEARGVGILSARAVASARLTLAVDLAQVESHRLPPRRSVSVLGTTLDLVLGSRDCHFPAAVMCYLKGGRTA